MQISDPLGQLVAPLLLSLFVTLMTWSLNRRLGHGKPMTAFAKKLLSHGFLFVLGIGLFIGWNDQLAPLLGFPGREVWRLLAVGWAALLLYDASRRLQRERQAATIVETDEVAGGTHRMVENVRATVMTLLRFLVFFAIVGAISRRSPAGFAVAAGLLAGEVILGRLWRISPPNGGVRHG